MSELNSPPRCRALLEVVAAMALMAAVIAVLGTAAGPAHAVPLGPCDGPCPTHTTPPPPPRRCSDCNSGATKPKQKLVTVYHSAYAFSTPYFNSRSRHPVRPTTYVATCEAYSSSAGRYGNHWWSRMRDGTWVNNGDLRGGVKMRIGDCAAPPNDGQPRGGRQGCDDCTPRAPMVLPTPSPSKAAPKLVPPPTAWISAYLTHWIKLQGPCVGTYTRDWGLYNANPDQWHDAAEGVREEEHGIFVTEVFKQIGVKQFRLYVSCTNRSHYRAMLDPTVYVHRELKQEWGCWGDGCQPFNIGKLQAGPWKPGLR